MFERWTQNPEGIVTESESKRQNLRVDFLPAGCCLNWSADWNPTIRF